MEIEIVKPTPEQAELQALFNQTDKETISLLMKEVEQLLQEKKKVYIVFEEEDDRDRFLNVFFTKEAAESYISGFTFRYMFSIKEYEETDEGRSIQIY